MNKQDQQNGEKSENKRDVTHVEKLLVIRFFWFILFMFMNALCVFAGVCNGWLSLQYVWLCLYMCVPTGK